MKTSAHVDWLAFTTDEETELKNLLPTLNGRLDYEYLGVGLYGYKQRWQGRNGAIVMKNGTPGMGTHVILNGSTLADYRAIGLTDKKVAQYVGKHRIKVSRCDIAIDVRDGAITPRSVVAAYRIGALTVPSKSASMIQAIHDVESDKNPGTTVYLGSRTSNRMMRIYNKGVQMGTDENWVRFELELKKLRAQSVIEKIQDDDLETRPIINKEMSDFLMWNNKHWQAIVADKQGEIIETERKITNTYKWLIETVAPAIARCELTQPDDSVIGALLTAVRLEINAKNPDKHDLLLTLVQDWLYNQD